MSTACCQKRRLLKSYLCMLHFAAAVVQRILESLALEVLGTLFLQSRRSVYMRLSALPD